MPDVCDMIIIPLQLTAYTQGLLASDDTIRGLFKYYQGHPEYSAGIFHYQELKNIQNIAQVYFK